MIPKPAEDVKKQVTKNDHVLAMLQTAKERQFRPRYVCFDGWYGSLANLKAVRGAKAQKCHILLFLRAFVRLEAHRLRTGISGYTAKANLIRAAIRLYLQKPTIQLEPTA